jgi:hypothetical protein
MPDADADADADAAAACDGCTMSRAESGTLFRFPSGFRSQDEGPLPSAAEPIPTAHPGF